MVISAPLPSSKRIRWILLGVLSSLLLAGYLRFDAGHPAWGRLLVSLTVVAVGFWIVYLASQADEHYRARPWELPIDQSRAWTHQQKRGHELGAQGKFRYYLSGVVKVAPPLAGTFYGLLVLLPGFPPLPAIRGLPEFAVWFVVAIILAVPPAAYLMRRGWRRTVAPKLGSAPSRTT